MNQQNVLLNLNWFKIYWIKKDMVSSKEKHKTLLFSLVIPIVFLQVQITAQPINFCGSYSTLPPSVNSDSLAFDRFGNSFDIASLRNSGSILQRSNSKVNYFNLTFLGNPPSDIQQGVENVFGYLSNIIQQRHGQMQCGEAIPAQTVNLQVVWLNFSNPDPALVAELNLVLPLPQRAAGIGTPFYIPSVREESCEELVLDQPFIKINGGMFNRNITGFDGRIILNSNLSAISSPLCPNTPLSWNTDATITIFPCQVYLYTVVLHEGLHVLGFASRIGLNSEYSLWDKSLRVADYISGGGVSGIPQSVLTNSTECVKNCWEITMDITTLSQNSCDPTFPGMEVVLGDAGIAPIAGDGSLSHLSSTCNGQNIDYVMKSGLNPGEYIRQLSGPEMDILCELGYSVVRPIVWTAKVKK